MADSDSSRYGWRDFLTDYGLLVTLIGIDHLAIKDAPFHDEGRGIYKEGKR